MYFVFKLLKWTVLVIVRTFSKSFLRIRNCWAKKQGLGGALILARIRQRQAYFCDLWIQGQSHLCRDCRLQVNQENLERPCLKKEEEEEGEGEEEKEKEE